MAFDEIRFPTLVTWGFRGGAEYSTDIIILSGGYEKRNVNWEVARARYDVAHTLKNQTQLDELIAFFRARQGKARGFRFRDWNDYKLQGEQIGIGDGSTTEFQIIKTYTSGVSEVRNIYKIVSDSDAETIAENHGSVAVTLDVKIDTTSKTEGVDFTIDRNTGIITFTSAPATDEIVSVSCEFDVPVRFDTDRMISNIDGYNSYNWEGIPLVEVRI